jgi:hypothetical protein
MRRKVTRLPPLFWPGIVVWCLGGLLASTLQFWLALPVLLGGALMVAVSRRSD